MKPVRLFIQIPCFNEEQTLPATIADLPRQIEGIADVKFLVVDDGSSDRTADVARESGVDYVVRHIRNQGLANAFRTGVDACLRLGADIIVNTDADNQYAGEDIPKLVQPILDDQAEIVVGDRQTQAIEGFSASKKLLQRLGSWVVRRLSGTRIPDAVSGFRAMSRAAALQINIISTFSYTIEMLIQAGRKRMSVESVPVGVNPQTRASRLFRSVPQFVAQSAVTTVRVYTLYEPLRVFSYLGALLALLGAAPIVRFLYLYALGDGAGHIQSLVLGGALLVVGFVTLLIGVVTDLIASNRRLIEILLEKIRRLELDSSRACSASDEPGP